MAAKVGSSFTVQGRLFSPGSYLGSDITFSDLVSSAATSPAVDYAYTSDEFLVVWAYWTTGVNSTIISQRITYAGEKIRANINIAQGHDTVSDYDPDLANNIARNECLAGGFFADNSSVAAGRSGDYLAAADDITLLGNRELYGWLLGNRNYIPQIYKP